MQDFNFRGYDYGELAHFFGAVDHNEDGVTYTAESLQEWLNKRREHMGWKEDIVAACRAYVKALIYWTNKNQHCGSLWEGLSTIYDNETFMQYFITLVPHAWD